MGIENYITSCNTVTVTGDINISPSVTLLTESNSYSNRCYAVTLEAKRGLCMLHQRVKAIYPGLLDVTKKQKESKKTGDENGR